MERRLGWQGRISRVRSEKNKGQLGWSVLRLHMGLSRLRRFADITCPGEPVARLGHGRERVEGTWGGCNVRVVHERNPGARRLCVVVWDRARVEMRDGPGLDVDGVLLRVCENRRDGGPATGVSGVSSVLCWRAWTAAGGAAEDEPDERADIFVSTHEQKRLSRHRALPQARESKEEQQTWGAQPSTLIRGTCDKRRLCSHRFWRTRQGLSARREMRARCDAALCVW